MTNRDYYQLLINKGPIELAMEANSKSERKLQIDQTLLVVTFYRLLSFVNDFLLECWEACMCLP